MGNHTIGVGLLLLLIASPARAVVITTVFVPSGSNFAGGQTAGIAPGTIAGGGNFQTIFNAAADWWEEALPGPEALTLQFGWGVQGGSTLAAHNLTTQAAAPNRETAGQIIFDNDGTSRWFLDATPLNSNEWNTYVEANLNLGGGNLNSQRQFSGYTGPLVAGNTPTDLFSVALHEIGHALGLGSANTAYQNETWPDNDIDVTGPRPLPGSVIPTNNGAVPEPGGTSNAHVNINSVLMWPFSSAGVRTNPTAIDILANAQLQQHASDLNPRPASLTATNAINFGNVLVGTIASQTLMVTNNGEAGGAMLGTFGGTAGDFARVGAAAFNDGAQNFLDQGDSSSRTYEYTPGARGADAQNVSVTSNGGNATVGLAGNGVAPVQATSHADAGNVRVGTSGSASVNIQNTGDGNLSGVAGSGVVGVPGGGSNLNGSASALAGEFSGGGGFSLADGENTGLSYTYTPAARGADSANVTVSYLNGNANGTNAAQSINVSLDGVGVGPVFQSNIAPASVIDFGAVPSGTTATIPLDISNISSDGVLPANLTDLTIDSLFTISGPDAAEFDLVGLAVDEVLQANGADVLNLLVEFDPGVPWGEKNALLTLRTDENAPFGATNAGSAFSWQLTGVSTPEPASVAIWALFGLGIFAYSIQARRSNRPLVP